MKKLFVLIIRLLKKHINQLQEGIWEILEEITVVITVLHIEDLIEVDQYPEVVVEVDLLVIEEVVVEV